MSDERRAPAQGHGRIRGTISWAEHVEAWHGYAKHHPGSAAGQDAERIAERGGFGLDELNRFLGHPPTTWETR